MLAAACVYASCECGQPFFSDVLSHFGVAPGQVVPNGWRIMVGFLALSRAAGVDHPPFAVFRHFFSCCTFKFNGWYCFRGKDTAGTLFTGLPNFIKQWKEGFFFLKSPVPWPCSVVWGEPSKSSTAEPELTGDEERIAAKLLLQRGPAAVDLRTYLTESRLAAATMVPPRAPPPPSPPSCRTSTSVAKGKMSSTTSHHTYDLPLFAKELRE